MADQHAGPSSVTTPKKKRKVRGELAKDEAEPSKKQHFSEAWLELPEFKGWLAPDPRNSFRASCKACNASLVAGHSELTKHSKRDANIKATAGLRKQNLMTAFVQKSNPHEQNVKTAEIEMSAFVAEHALSFKAIDHLGELAKVVFHDSAIAKGSQLRQLWRNACLRKRSRPLTNIIALACDNASVMVGERNSLMTRLLEKADESFITIRCICHSLHIAASKAALKLPRNAEDLLRNLCKRQAQLAELQEYLHKEKNKILRSSETRWLVLHQCVERVLREWETLKLLFLQAATEDRIVAAET
ncbi:hypothetical protein HPB47_001785 [Ixodes persulcatus]|uniref:Uncharacterized protein n=1 Tax=Ixodes persulcatus TaxID=34615 RepID=A0AC60PPU7_IXOPE|nr:hypothetical protein HPB47_001785 [Ixodes persulcatus]